MGPCNTFVLEIFSRWFLQKFSERVLSFSYYVNTIRKLFNKNNTFIKACFNDNCLLQNLNAIFE